MFCKNADKQKAKNKYFAQLGLDTYFTLYTGLKI